VIAHYCEIGRQPLTVFVRAQSFKLTFAGIPPDVLHVAIRRSSGGDADGLAELRPRRVRFRAPLRRDAAPLPNYFSSAAALQYLAQQWLPTPALWVTVRRRGDSFASSNAQAEMPIGVLKHTLLKGRIPAPPPACCGTKA